MATLITRTFTSSTINSATVTYKDGKLVSTDNKPITAEGKISEEKALRLVIKEFGKNGQYVVKSVDYSDKTLAMKTADFLAVAFEVTKAEAEAAEKETPKPSGPAVKVPPVAPPIPSNQTR